MSTEYIEGHALVASPFMTDRNFRRSVVFIVKHDEEGAYGLILNRPLEMTIGKLLQKVLDYQVENAQPIYDGGPVEGPVVAIHEHPTPEGNYIEPGVYLSSNQEVLTTICQQTSERYRIFNGYAGWGPGQLEDELRQGGWLVYKLEKADIFAEPENQWQNAVRHIGRQIIADSIDLPHPPSDPSVN